MCKVKVATRLCRNRKTHAVSDKERERERSPGTKKGGQLATIEADNRSGYTNIVNCIFRSLIHSLYVYIH